MSIYVIAHGDDPELHMQQAIDAGADCIQVGFPDGMTEPGIWHGAPDPTQPDPHAVVANLQAAIGTAQDLLDQMTATPADGN